MEPGPSEVPEPACLSRVFCGHGLLLRVGDAAFVGPSEAHSLAASLARPRTIPGRQAF